MFDTLRRVVTGHNAQGNSIIEIDGGPATQLEANGSGLFEIWQTKFAATENQGPANDTLAGTDPQLHPAPGCTKLRWFAVPPENADASAEDLEAAAAFGFEVVGAKHARVDTSRHPMMHKTDSVDYIIVITGEVDMLVDEGEVTSLKPGDVVVQRGTNHAWVNKGSEPALLVAVLTDAS